MEIVIEGAPAASERVALQVDHGLERLSHGVELFDLHVDFSDLLGRAIAIVRAAPRRAGGVVSSSSSSISVSVKPSF